MSKVYLAPIFGRDVRHVVSASLMNSQSRPGRPACNSNNRLQKKQTAFLHCVSHNEQSLAAGAWRELIQGLRSSYLKYSRSAHDQGEEHRKVWSQDFHKHGDVVKNISKKPEGEYNANIWYHQWFYDHQWINKVQPFNLKIPNVPPLFGFRVQFTPAIEAETTSVIV